MSPAVTEPDAFTCNIGAVMGQIDVSSNGGSDGSATVTATGSQSGVTYMWSNSEVTTTISGLVAGGYTVTVSDDILANCTAVGSVTITQPAPPCNISVTATSTDVRTFGGNKASAMATAT